MFTSHERTILDQLHQRGEVELATLAGTTEIPRSSAYVALRHLVEMGVLEATKQGGVTRYRIATRDVLERVVQHISDEFRAAVLTPASHEKPELVFTDGYGLPESQLRELRTRYGITKFSAPGIVDQETFVRRTRNADVIVTFDYSVVDRAFLKSVPRLKAVVSPACFPLTIDVEACEDFGVIVVHPNPITQKYYATRQVEYAVNAAFRLVQPMHRAAKIAQYDWRECIGEDLFAKNVGIMTGGTNIRPLVEIFQAFGCDVGAATSDPVPLLSSEFGLNGYMDLDALWDWSDILITLDGADVDLDAFLTRDTSPKYIVIMSSQVDFDIDLIQSRLDSGAIAGLALDMVPQRWRSSYGDSELTTRMEGLAALKNVIVTPEAGVFSVDSMRRSHLQVFKMLMSLQLPAA